MNSGLVLDIPIPLMPLARWSYRYEDDCPCPIYSPIYLSRSVLLEETESAKRRATVLANEEFIKRRATMRFGCQIYFWCLEAKVVQIGLNEQCKLSDSQEWRLGSLSWSVCYRTLLMMQKVGLIGKDFTITPLRKVPPKTKLCLRNFRLLTRR